MIISKLKKSGATREENAKSLEEAGVLNPNSFSKITDKLIKDNVLVRTKDNKYYIKINNYNFGDYYKK